MNGYVETNGEPQIWVARRSRSKPTAPGKLDHLVAGGQPIGIGLTENLIKEAAEEASLPEALARRARPAGLWPLERVVRTLESGDEFKFNVALVIIDFLVRRGHLGPDHPDYVAIVHGLRLPA